MKIINYVMNRWLEITLLFFIVMIAIRFTSSTVLSVYNEWHPVAVKCEPVPVMTPAIIAPVTAEKVESNDRP